ENVGDRLPVLGPGQALHARGASRRLRLARSAAGQCQHGRKSGRYADPACFLSRHAVCAQCALVDVVTAAVLRASSGWMTNAGMALTSNATDIALHWP